MGGQRETNLSGRHPGGLKNGGKCRAGRGTRGEELPGSICYFSEGAKNKEGIEGGGSKNWDK